MERLRLQLLRQNRYAQSQSTLPAIPPEPPDVDQMESEYGFGPTCDLGCKHSFHRNCILQWYRTRINNSLNHNCPVCRDNAPDELIITKVISTVSG